MKNKNISFKEKLNRKRGQVKLIKKSVSLTKKVIKLVNIILPILLIVKKFNKKNSSE